MVGVAQLVELRIVIPAVVGSNPIVHPSLGELKNTVLNATNRGYQRLIKSFDGDENRTERFEKCGSGGIGRRAGFRFQCRKA